MGFKEMLGAAALVIVAAVGLVATGVVVERRFLSSTAASELPTRVSESEVEDWSGLTTYGHRVGPNDASVVLVEFGDFECPACRPFEGALRGIRAQYPESVAIVYRHWPLSYHTHAAPAAMAAECAAQQDRFWAFHDSLYAAPEQLDSEDFLGVAKNAGIPDMRAFGRCLGDSVTTRIAIDRDLAAVNRITGATGTPTLLINGKLLHFVPDSSELDAYVRRLLAAEAR